MTSTLALTGTWTADTVHSDVSFKVRHMGVGKAKGTFAVRVGDPDHPGYRLRGRHRHRRDRRYHREHRSGTAG